MRIRLFFALIVTLLAVSACIIEPDRGGGGYYGHHDYGRGVWRG
jgi:hypothetical protein